MTSIEQVAAWKGHEGVHRVEDQDRRDAVNGGFNEHSIAVAAIGDRRHVLAIGRSNGQTTRPAARRAPHGHVVGIDLSTPLLARARASAAVRFGPGRRAGRQGRLLPDCVTRSETKECRPDDERERHR